MGVGSLRRARPPQALAAQPAPALHGARRGGQAPRPRQPARARRPRLPRASRPTTLGYRHYEGIRLDSGEETGAWLSLTIAAHELIYVKDAREAGGRLHHLAFWVDTREECLRAADIFLDSGVHIEAAPSRHAVAAGFFLYSFEPGGNRIEVTTGGYFVYEPDPEPVIWTEAERARGQAWGVKTVESFHYYGTPPTAEDRELRARGGRGRAVGARRSGARSARATSVADPAGSRRYRSPRATTWCERLVAAHLQRTTQRGRARSADRGDHASPERDEPGPTIAPE